MVGPGSALHTSSPRTNRWHAGLQHLSFSKDIVYVGWFWFPARGPSCWPEFFFRLASMPCTNIPLVPCCLISCGMEFYPGMEIVRYQYYSWPVSVIQIHFRFEFMMLGFNGDGIHKRHKSSKIRTVTKLHFSKKTTSQPLCLRPLLMIGIRPAP